MFTVCILICLLSASRFSSSLFPQFLSWSCVLWLLHLSGHSRRALHTLCHVASTLTLGLCVLFCPHFDVASAPTLGLQALISLCLTLSASWSDWRLDWADPPVPVPILCLELRLQALFTGRVLCSEILRNI